MLTRDEGSPRQWFRALSTGALWKCVSELGCPLGKEREGVYRMALAFSESPGLIDQQPCAVFVSGIHAGGERTH